MDIAIVLSGHRHGGQAADLMLRPFAESSLLEHAMARLDELDAPCRKYVACADREIKNLCAQYPSLHSLRASHLSDWPDLSNAKMFSHLKPLPEQWFLVVNPAFPFVTADLWWQVIEDFLAGLPAGIVSAEVQKGPVYSLDGRPLDGGESFIVRNEAFVLVPRTAFEKGAGPDLGQYAPYVLPYEATRRIHDASDVAAAEAVSARHKLGLSV